MIIFKDSASYHILKIHHSVTIHAKCAILALVFQEKIIIVILQMSTLKLDGWML